MKETTEEVLEMLLDEQESNQIEPPLNELALAASFYLEVLLRDLRSELSDKEKYALSKASIYLAEELVPPKWAVQGSLEVVRRLEED